MKQPVLGTPVAHLSRRRAPASKRPTDDSKIDAVAAVRSTRHAI
jgi:hypothetical protein